jgi:hypothetical protein
MKFKNMKQFRKEAEKRGLYEGVPFRCAYHNKDVNRNWTWNDFEIDVSDDISSIVEFGIFHAWLYDAKKDKWAVPLTEVNKESSDIEKRVEELEAKVKELSSPFRLTYTGKEAEESCIEQVNPNHVSQPHEVKADQPLSSRDFIAKGIIEKIYPKDERKALEAIRFIMQMDLGNLDRVKMSTCYGNELLWYKSGNSFKWDESLQGGNYWDEIYEML